jgi:hypothetical protein
MKILSSTTDTRHARNVSLRVPNAIARKLGLFKIRKVKGFDVGYEKRTFEFVYIKKIGGRWCMFLREAKRK